MTDDLCRLARRLLLPLAVAGLAFGCASGGGNGTDTDLPADPGSDPGAIDGNANDNDNDDAPDEPDTPFELVGDPLAGADLYNDVVYACFVCHGQAGEGTDLAPSALYTSVGELEQTLSPEGQHSGGTHDDLSTQDIADLSAYLADTTPPIDTTTNGTDVDTNGLL